MRALQALVIVLGLLIFAGLAAIAGAVIKGGHHPPPSLKLPPPDAPTTYSTVVVPQGYHIVEVRANSEFLLLELAGPNGKQLLDLVNPVTGHLISSLEVKTSNAP